MGAPHLVRRGDSLWDLPGRYLGNHSLWPSIHGCKFRFSADVNIKVDVTLHPRLRCMEFDPLHNFTLDRVPAAERTRTRLLPIKTELLIGGTIVAGVVLVVTASPFWVPAAAVAIGKGTLNMLGRQRRPYRHVIDPDDPRLRS